jgi:HEAT repeat protein
MGLSKLAGKKIAQSPANLVLLAPLGLMESQHSTNSVGQSPVDGDEFKEIRAKLAQFALSLIQAFLRTGYYTSDHPESKKARIGLYEEFQALFIQRDELTFLVRDDPGGKNILIEGILPETQYLSRLMLRGMAEMYIPKFAHFLERKDLTSLSVKNAMTRTEFTSFIDVISEPNFVDTRSETDKERFSRILKERGIVNISYIFNEELLVAKRNLPWRAQLALTRLRKDLRMIPLYRNLDEEGQKKVRQEIIQDVIRPIRSAEVICHILMNSDLAMTKEFEEYEIDREVIMALGDELLVKTTQILLKEASRQESTEAPEEKGVTLVRLAASILYETDIAEKDVVLEACFKSNFIPFEQLSKVTQQKIKLERLTHKFLRYSTRFFNQFEKIQDREKYLHSARTFVKIIPELVRRDRYEEILKIVAHIDRHFIEKKHLSIYAGQILEEIGRGEIPDALKEKFLNEKKEIRQAIAPIFLKLHVGAVPHLLSILKESDDQWVRKHACEILTQIGSLAINFILDALNKKEIGTEATIDIIRVLGEIKSEEWTQPLARNLEAYLNNKDPQLRGEALSVYYKILGSEGEKLYLRLLSDPDLGVQKKAVQCLSRIKSESALIRFLEMLEDFEESPPDENQEMEACLFAALSFYGTMEGPGTGILEDFLLETLERRLTLGAHTFLKKKQNPISEEAVAAICETLGKIGTEKSSQILQKLEKQHVALWNKKAAEALKRISEREGGLTGSLSAAP